MIQFVALERSRLIPAFTVALLSGLVWSSSTFAQTTPPANNPTAPDPALIAPLFFVNNQAVLPEMLDRVRRGNPVFNAKFAGAIGQDFQNLLLDQAILLEVTRQDAAGILVTEDEVEKFVSDFRTREKLVTEEAYNARLEKLAYTDSSLREVVRESFRLNKRIAQVRETASITPVELEFFLKFNREKFAASGVLQDRVLARQIVVQSLETAKEMFKRAKAGADFAALARSFQHLIERGQRRHSRSVLRLLPTLREKASQRLAMLLQIFHLRRIGRRHVKRQLFELVVRNRHVETIPHLANRG